MMDIEHWRKEIDEVERRVGTRVAQENRDVCWTEAKSGSKLKVTRCGTQEEIDEARRGARAWMEKPKICSGPGCG